MTASFCFTKTQKSVFPLIYTLLENTFNLQIFHLFEMNPWLGSGTPLQNDLMELWSLMHFLMPQIFASHAQFKDWFNNPLVGMVEGQHEVNKVLSPASSLLVTAP